MASSLHMCGAATAAALTVTILLSGLTLPSQAASICRLKRPNIIFILLDDAGWADFKSNDPLMNTSNIDALRQEGVFLNYNYVLPMCAPTRSALMTGRYPHTYGASTGKVTGTNKKFWVNETFPFISDEMKEVNYTTHMLGKWHLGFCHPSLTPLERGFDTFYGMVLGAHSSYYTHMKGKTGPYDWWDNNEIDWEANGTYNTELLNNRAVKIISESNSSTRPFFMYLAYPAPHGPKEVPQEYIDKYCPEQNFAGKVTEATEARRVHCGMMAAVDVGIGSIVQTLKDKDLYNNTVILLMSDNGGDVRLGASNYPLRGSKKTVYEGGTRVYTVLKAPCLDECHSKYNGLIHAVDWMPTLVAMAGGKQKDYMQGYNVWNRIKNGKVSPRKEMLYTRDDYYKFNHSAFRYKHWKLIQGKPGFDQGWYAPPNVGPLEDRKKKYSPMDYEFYNLKEDPEERNNLYGKECYEAEFNKTLKRRDDFLKKFPLQPFVESEKYDDWKDEELTVVNTCWCQPPGTENDQECPKPSES